MDDKAPSSILLSYKDVETALPELVEIGQLYILKDRVPVPEPSALKWLEWYWQTERCVVGRQLLSLKDGKRGMVSTVFLGMCCGVIDDKPALFETLVLVGCKEIARQRYATWDNAEKGHREIVDLIAETAIKKRSQK